MLFVPTAELSVTMPLAGSVDDTPQRQHFHVEAFCVDRTEVPMKSYSSAECGEPDRTCLLNASRNGPAVCISERQAECHCERSTPPGKRLPTDAEWLLAALGTDGRPFPWGSSAYPSGYVIGQNFCPEQANVATKDMMCPVDANVLDVSPFGAIGMGTNGTEMTSSCLVPESAPGSLRCVIRGASIDAGPLRATTLWPKEETALTATSNKSFRCVTSERASR